MLSGVKDYDGILYLNGQELSQNAQQSAVETEQKAAVRKQYEGTEQWMKAPNGKPTKLTEEQWLAVRTAAFKEWFGDWENDPENASKVVDENGEPLVVHHGTDAEFNTFKSENNAYFFSESTDYAEAMAEERNGSKLYDVFLNIKNPLIVELPDNSFSDPNTEKPYIKQAKEQGNDGVAFKNNSSDELYSDVFHVAFNPAQIKSATANNGDFDINDPNIYHQEKQDNSPWGDYSDTNKEGLAWIAENPFVYDESKSIDENIADAEKMAQEYLDKFGETDKINSPRRQELRLQVANKLYREGAKKKDGKVWLIVGAPASGKSTISDPIVEQEGALLIDSDEAKKQLPEFSKGLLATAVHEESSDITSAILYRAISNKDNIVLPIVGKTYETLAKKINIFKNHGYEVNLVYVDLPIENAIDRVKNRFKEEGRLVSPAYLKSVELKPKDNYDRLKLEKEVDSYEAWDNNVERGDDPILIESSGGQSEETARRLGRLRDERQRVGQIGADVGKGSHEGKTSKNSINTARAQRHSDDQGAFSDGEKHKKGNPLRQFAGRNSMTQNGEKYMEAYHMWREEKPMGEIFEKTGWFRGVDGKWRYEIQDNLSTINFGELLHLDYPGQVRRLHEIYKNPIQEFEKVEADWFSNDALDTEDEILAAADATLRKAEANLFYQGFRL